MRRAAKLRVIDGAASVVVPMSSQGILDFASTLHATATRMDREAVPQGQAFLGSWQDFVGARPWEDGPPPRGLRSLVSEIRGFVHVINPTADYERLSRFNQRMQALWDMGAAKGWKWTEPRPLDTEPGKSESAASTFENLGTIALVVGLLWVLSRGK